MSIASVSDALAQYNANLDWHTSQSKATNALSAIRYLLVNRAQKMADQGTEVDYEGLQAESVKLERFLGASAPRAFGRKRRVGIGFDDGNVT
jgi:hypothetical protein